MRRGGGLEAGVSWGEVAAGRPESHGARWRPGGRSLMGARAEVGGWPRRATVGPWPATAGESAYGTKSRRTSEYSPLTDFTAHTRSLASRAIAAMYWSAANLNAPWAETLPSLSRSCNCPVALL